MAIYTGGMRQKAEATKEAKRLAAVTAKQEAKAQKRSGWSNLLGGVGGKILGTALAGMTGGLAAPLLMAAGTFAGKKLAHEATRGMGADLSAIKSQSKYGYGVEEAKTLREGLKQQMAVDPMKERGGFGKDLLSAYSSAALSGDLTGSAKALISGDKGSIAQALVGKDGWKGAAGAKEAFLGLLPEGEDYIEKGKDPTMDYQSLAGSDMTGSEYDQLVANRQAAYTEPEFDWGMSSPISEPIGQSYEVSDTPIPFQQPYDQSWIQSGFPMAQGGQVMDQEQLMQLLALAQMQQQGQTTYDNTPLEEKRQPTISEMFASQGKTLGGNNTQSLSQMLGR